MTRIKLRVYSIVGSIPYYLCFARRHYTIDEIVAHVVIHPYGPLRDEKDLILREEFRDSTLPEEGILLHGRPPYSEPGTV